VESKTYKEMKAAAEAIDKVLISSDFNKGYIEFMCEDGTHCMYDSAIYKDLNKEWFAIFTEHYGFFIHNKDEVEWVKKWERPEILYWKER